MLIIHVRSICGEMPIQILLPFSELGCWCFCCSRCRSSLQALGVHPSPNLLPLNISACSIGIIMYTQLVPCLLSPPSLGHFSHDFTLYPLQICSFIFREPQVRPEMEASPFPGTQAAHLLTGLRTPEDGGVCVRKPTPKASLPFLPLLAPSWRWGSLPVAPAVFPPRLLAERAAFFPGSTACLFKGLITAA